MRSTRAIAALALILSSAAPAAPTASAPACPGPRAGSARSFGAEGPNLVLDRDFPDPFLARLAGSFHGYATGTGGGAPANVQHIASPDLTRWSEPSEALPHDNLPAWVDRSYPQVWAPEVMEVAGRYVLYFNARHASLTRTETPPEGPRVLKRQCIGAAVADAPEGPFVGIDEPLVCAEAPWGAIDASPFRDGDSLYLYYKDDGNCCGRGSALYVQGLSPDGLAPVGPRHRLLANNDSPGPEDDWEWQVVEAPTMVKRGRAYFLFYSGNFFGNKNYSVAYLRCRTPRGPCTDLGENPILWSHPGQPVIGPGHQTLLDRGGRSYVFFHGWNVDPDAKAQPGVHKRCLYVGRVRWEPAPGGERPRIVRGTPSKIASPSAD